MDLILLMATCSSIIWLYHNQFARSNATDITLGQWSANRTAGTLGDHGDVPGHGWCLIFLSPVSSNSFPEIPGIMLLFLSHSLSHLTRHSQSLALSRGVKTPGTDSETILSLVLDLRNWKTLVSGQKVHLQVGWFLCFNFYLFLLLL